MSNNRVPLYKQYTKAELEKIVSRCESWKELLFALGYGTSTGNNKKNVESYLIKLNINTEHFRTRLKEISDEEMFCVNSKAGHTTLRNRIKENNLLPYVCDICGLEPVWQGKPLTLILDHSNGIKNDNRLENLHWVCPNCNQQLQTTGFKGYVYNENGEKVKKVAIKQPVFSDKDLADFEELKQKYGVTRNKLKRDLRTKRFVAIGEKYGVSDNAIRRWCKKFALPYLASEIKAYTDAEWEKI